MVQAYSDNVQWWRDHKLKFPPPLDLARNTLRVMAISVDSERVRGMAENIVNSRRSNVKSSSVNRILFFSSAFKI